MRRCGWQNSPRWAVWRVGSFRSTAPRAELCLLRPWLVGGGASAYGPASEIHRTVVGGQFGVAAHSRVRRPGRHPRLLRPTLVRGGHCLHEHAESSWWACGSALYRFPLDVVGSAPPETDRQTNRQTDRQTDRRLPTATLTSSKMPFPSVGKAFCYFRCLVAP